jgi:holin-like protein
LIGLFCLSALFFGGKYVLLQFNITMAPALVGIAALFVALLLLMRVPIAISKAADPLLGNMSLFFIPVIVAIVNYIDLILAYPLALFLSIVVSTLLSLAITAWLSQRLMRMLTPKDVNTAQPPNKVS